MIWGHISSLHSNLPSQTLHLRSHLQGLWGDKPPRPCTWGHTTTASRVTAPHQYFYLWSHLHSLQSDHHSQMVNIWSHIHSLQSDTTQDTEPVVTHPQTSG